jgi:hypothetical protein
MLKIECGFHSGGVGALLCVDGKLGLGGGSDGEGSVLGGALFLLDGDSALGKGSDGGDQFWVGLCSGWMGN